MLPGAAVFGTQQDFSGDFALQLKKAFSVKQCAARVHFDVRSDKGKLT